MVTATINVGKFSPYDFREKEGYIPLPSYHSERFFSSSDTLDNRPDGIEDDKILNLMSDSKKLMVTAHRSFYHFLVDFIGKLSYQLSIDKDVEVIIDKSIIESSPIIRYSSVYRTVLEALDYHGVKYRLIDFSSYNLIKINNFYSLAKYQARIDYPKYVADFYSFYIEDKNIKPYRKIFISRAKVGDRNLPTKKPWISVDNDDRTDSYKNLEDYFASLGFEIIYAEEIPLFKDQINLFYQSEIIVGTSGSGLTNAIFMQEKTTMVELMTPLIIHVPNFMLHGEDAPREMVEFSEDAFRPVEEIHLLYHEIAFHKNQKYISISSRDRLSENIKATINGDTHLKSILLRNE